MFLFSPLVTQHISLFLPKLICRCPWILTEGERGGKWQGAVQRGAELEVLEGTSRDHAALLFSDICLPGETGQLGPKLITPWGGWTLQQRAKGHPAKKITFLSKCQQYSLV